MANSDARSNNDRGRLSAPWQSFAETLSRIPKVALLSMVGPVVASILVYLLWINYGAKHLNTSLYGLQLENVTLTPQPAWIHSNISAEVFEGSQLDQLSLLDRQMSASVWNAYRSHPWIRKVFRVQKLAGSQVRVDVEYREPLAMIYQETSTAKDNKTKPVSTSSESMTASPSDQAPPKKASFLPVDVDGVLLPTQDFKPDQVPDYLLIYAQSAVPIGMVGSDFGDVRIKEALGLCRILKELRLPLGLERIYVYPDSSNQSPSGWMLEITTRTNQRIRWGHAPGLEAVGEPGSPAKLRKLTQFLSKPTPDEQTLQEIDLVVAAKPTGNFQLFQKAE